MTEKRISEKNIPNKIEKRISSKETDKKISNKTEKKKSNNENQISHIIPNEEQLITEFKKTKKEFEESKEKIDKYLKKDRKSVV